MSLHPTGHFGKPPAKQLAFARPSASGRRMLYRMPGPAHQPNPSTWIDDALRGAPIQVAAQRIAPAAPAADGRGLIVELLVRPSVGTHAHDPGDTIALAEATGRAPRLDCAIARQAAAYIASRPDDPSRYAINLSGLSFRQPGQADRLNAILADHRVDPRRIIWEIGERHTLEPTGATRDNLLAIEASGAAIALDDFGVKCANLSLLTLVEIQYVKFDRSLTQALLPADADRRRRLMGGFQGFAEAAGAQIIFEGVESHEELAILRGFAPPGAWIQGYAIHRPSLVIGPPTSECLCCATNKEQLAAPGASERMNCAAKTHAGWTPAFTTGM